MIKTIMNSILLFMLLTLVACGGEKNAVQRPQSEESVELVISAAASLTDVLETLKEMYAIENPHVNLVYNMGPSGQLQQQIEQGAPADVFISAAQKQMNELEAKELIVKETRVDILSNELVLIAPTDSTIQSFEDLMNAHVQHIGIGSPESVPAGQYAKVVLEKMNLWDELASKLVEGQNVRTVLSYVETGNAEAGFVYRSDTVVSDKVKIVATPPADIATPILYPAAVVKATKNQDAATDFIQFLRSGSAIEIFEQYRFKAN